MVVRLSSAIGSTSRIGNRIEITQLFSFYTMFFVFFEFFSPGFYLNITRLIHKLASVVRTVVLFKITDRKSILNRHASCVYFNV